MVIKIWCKIHILLKTTYTSNKILEWTLDMLVPICVHRRLSYQHLYYFSYMLCYSTDWLSVFFPSVIMLAVPQVSHRAQRSKMGSGWWTEGKNDQQNEIKRKNIWLSLFVKQISESSSSDNKQLQFIVILG